jgi:hypothetical protein
MSKEAVVAYLRHNHEKHQLDQMVIDQYRVYPTQKTEMIPFEVTCAVTSCEFLFSG